MVHSGAVCKVENMSEGNTKTVLRKYYKYLKRTISLKHILYKTEYIELRIGPIICRLYRTH